MNNEEKYKEAFDSLTEEACCEVNFTTKNEDLEEEIDKCWEGWIDPNPEVKIVAGYLSKDEFSTYARHFAEWQKQQMMKDAVNGEYWIGEIHLDTPIIQGYDDGDRIKFIPIKEIQQ